MASITLETTTIKLLISIFRFVTVKISIMSQAWKFAIFGGLFIKMNYIKYTPSFILHNYNNYIIAY